MFRLVDGNDEALLDIGVLGACAAPLDEMYVVPRFHIINETGLVIPAKRPTVRRQVLAFGFGPLCHSQRTLETLADHT